MGSKEDRSRARKLLEKDHEEWTDEDVVWALTRCYTADEVPPCCVCGGPLSPMSMGGGRPTTWGCDGRVMNPNTKKWEWPEDRKPADDHYRESRWTQYRTGDDLVLEVIKRFQAALKEVESLLKWKRQALETGALNQCYCGEVTLRGSVHRECRDRQEQREATYE